MTLIDRTGQIWRANFNGYPVIGIITKSHRIGERYAYYPDGKYDLWNHWVKILSSSRMQDVGKTHKWKEQSNAVWMSGGYMQQIMNNNTWKWEML